VEQETPKAPSRVGSERRAERMQCAQSSNSSGRVKECGCAIKGQVAAEAGNWP
jgi:hypothetical protein